MTDTPEEGPDGTEIADGEDFDVYWEDREASKGVNGIYTNRVFVYQTNDGLLRINFGEMVDDAPRYHTAIVVSPTNAVIFAQLMHQVASPMIQPPPLEGGPEPVGEGKVKNG